MIVNKLRFPTLVPPVALVEKVLNSENIPFYTLDHVNWKDFPYKPDVKFRLAYGRRELYLQFCVKEKSIRAQFTDDETSEPSKDTCVAFYITPADDGLYYNFEFNGIGTCLLSCGKDRHDRHRFDASVTSLIRRTSSLGNEPFGERSGDFEWTLTAAIPFTVFAKHQIISLDGKTCRANFYKCGDELAEPHFVSWHPIQTGQPDYHRPEFFGAIHMQARAAYDL